MAPTMTGCQNHLLLIVPATADQQGVDAAAGYILAEYLPHPPNTAPFSASTFTNPNLPSLDWLLRRYVGSLHAGPTQPCAYIGSTHGA